MCRLLCQLGSKDTEMNMIQLLSLEEPRKYWVPLLLAMILLQSVLTHGHQWPQQECPCHSQVEAHDENDNRAQVLEYLKMEILEKKDRENEPKQFRKVRPGPLQVPMNQGMGLDKGHSEQHKVEASLPSKNLSFNKFLMGAYYVVGMELRTGGQ